MPTLQNIVINLNRKTPEERFWRHVNKTDACWLWTASTNFHHYGQFAISKDRAQYAHRYSYELHYGIKLTKDDTLDHRCRVRQCVNPEHLDRVSRSVNTERMLAYKSLASEIRRLRELLKSHGIDAGPDIL